MTAYVQARRAEGIHRFQLKIGADPYEDAARTRSVVDATGPEDVVVADANGGWRLQDAVVAARLLDGLERVFFEQPCPTLEECLIVRERTTLPMVLDECITDVQSLLRAYEAKAMEAFNLKISKVGGLTQAKLMRDLAVALGLRVTIEDTWGGDLVTAAVSHLAASTPPDTLFTVSFMNDWTNEHVAGHEPRSQDGFGSAPTGPGLGVDVDRRGARRAAADCHDLTASVGKMLSGGPERGRDLRDRCRLFRLHAALGSRHRVRDIEDESTIGLELVGCLLCEQRHGSSERTQRPFFDLRR